MIARGWLLGSGMPAHVSSTRAPRIRHWSRLMRRAGYSSLARSLPILRECFTRNKIKHCCNRRNRHRCNDSKRSESWSRFVDRHSGGIITAANDRKGQYSRRHSYPSAPFHLPKQYITMADSTSEAPRALQMGAKGAYIVRLLMVGDSACGKTSLVLRFDQNVFSTKFVTTIGVDYRDKMVKVCNNGLLFIVKNEPSNSSKTKFSKNAASGFSSHEHSLLYTCITD
jgi:hypothetical protein